MSNIKFTFPLDETEFDIDIKCHSDMTVNELAEWSISENIRLK